MSSLFRINTNLNSQFAQRQLSGANRNLNEASERLSSGKRVNSAADDAAGLAISQKMTTQIRGISMGTRNAQDGMSMIQTAEGSLDESQSSLQRMRELSIQAASDALTREDRDKIQEELNEVAIEMQRIADDTEFNERKLLNGTLEDAQIQVGANERQRVNISVNDMGTESTALDVAEYGGTDQTVTSIAVSNSAPNGGTQDIDNNDDGRYRVTRDNNDLVIKDSTGTTVAETVTDDENLNSLGFSSKNEGVVYRGVTGDSNGGFGDDVVSFQAAVKEGDFVISNGNFLRSTISDQELQDGVAQNGLEAGRYEVESNSGGGFTLVNDKGQVEAVTPGNGSTGEFIDPITSATVLDFRKSTIGSLGGGGDQIFTGGEKVTVGGPNVSQNLQKANNAITQVDRALEEVSEQRADLGARQNRLERTMNVNNITEENLQASRSRIQDADIAEESVKRTRANILIQASTSVLSQANQNPQLALQLLG